MLKILNITARSQPFWVYETGDDLQQNPPSVHLQHVHGRDDPGADQQPGCYRNQPADVVPLPLPQPVGHACAGKRSRESCLKAQFMTELSLCLTDCDGSGPALLSVGMERFGRSVCYSSAGSGSVPHRCKTGRHTKKLTRE